MSKSEDELAIVERVQRIAGSLTTTEQRLISELLTAPRQIAVGTSHEFAARLGVHEATTSRLARKLGFRSYASFRDQLRSEYLSDAAPGSRVSASLKEAETQGYLPMLIANEIAALSSVQDHVDDARVLQAAQVLNKKRVFIYGQGNAETLSVLMDRRLRRLNIDSRQLSGNARDLAEQASLLTKEDALLVFAFRRQPLNYAPLLEVARSADVRTVVIAGTIGPSLVPVPDILLSAPRAGLPDSFQTLTVPMAICNAIVLALASLQGSAAINNLNRLGELIANFEKRPAR